MPKDENHFMLRWPTIPPVSVVHRDRPAGVNITWGLARGDVSEHDVQAAIAAEAEAEIETADSETKEEKVAKRIFMQGRLPKRQQLRGTIQKNEFVWSLRAPMGTPTDLPSQLKQCARLMQSSGSGLPLP